MDQIEEFVDERQKAWCVHCGGWLANLRTNRDHIPSRNLLSSPLPENLPVMSVCADCNNGFSADEAYVVAFLSSVLSGSTEPDRQHSASAARSLAKNAGLRARIDASRSSYVTHGGETCLIWTPELERVERIAVKNARGHAFFEFGEPMLADPTHVWCMPLSGLTESQRRDFEDVDPGNAWPEVGSRMMTRVLTGQDLEDAWVVVQDDVYRYAVVQNGTLRVRSVIWEYLATEVYWE